MFKHIKSVKHLSNEPWNLNQTGKTRRVCPESGRDRRSLFHKESAIAATKTPRRSARASLAEAPAEGKSPSWSAASLAAPAKRERMDPTQVEWLRRKW